MGKQTLTIGIGVHKRQKCYIPFTLESIYYSLQKYSCFDMVKLIITNDDEQDVEDYIFAKNFKKLLDNVCVQFKSNDKNMGIAYTYHKMIQQCSTEYFMTFDSDDILGDFDISKQIQFLQENKQFSGSYGYRRLCDFQKKEAYCCAVGSQYSLDSFIDFDCPINNNGIILRVRDALFTGNYIGEFLKANGFKNGVDVSTDFSMFVAMLSYKDLYFSNQVRCLYNQRQKCYHKNKVHLYKQQFQVIAKSVIKYCLDNDFKYKNMKPLYLSANKFLQNPDFYVKKSWLRQFV